jgi:hypothetical protein
VTEGCVLVGMVGGRRRDTGKRKRDTKRGGQVMHRCQSWVRGVGMILFFRTTASEIWSVRVEGSTSSHFSASENNYFSLN